MTTIRVQVEGGPQLRALLERVNPRKRPQIWRDILGGIAAVIERIAKRENIIPGGKGPPDPRRLTSRTGIGRRSITTDTSELPRAVSVGTDRVYMALHERGGTVNVPRHTVRAHQRNVAFGRRVAAFQVPAHERGPYRYQLRARPWLQPAIERAGDYVDDIMLRALQKAAGTVGA